MKISNLHPELRPKEKFLQNGIKNLSVVELLSILINSGNKKYNALEISSNLITKYGNINNISKLSIEELASNYGIGKNKALTILAALNINRFEANNYILSDFNKISKYCQKHFIDNSYERILILFLRGNFELIIQKTITQLRYDKVNFRKDNIRDMALKFQCQNIIIIHNHPNNIAKFSSSDIKTIKRLLRYLKMYGINIVDNVLYTDYKIINYLPI